MKIKVISKSNLDTTIPDAIISISSHDKNIIKFSCKSLNLQFDDVLEGEPHCMTEEDANKEFKPDGVYNSSDERYVTANLFKKLGYGRLVCFCSPAQLMRKALSYIQFGVIPDIYSVPIKNMFNNYVDETFRYIPELINDKTGLQSNSKEAERLRKLRKPY